MRSPRRGAFAFAVVFTVATAAAAAAADPAPWPRFRGPNGQGIAADGARPPVEFGPGKNLAWKTRLPPGHSSPVVAAGKIFLTACAEGKLETICVDAGDGKLLWRRTAPAEHIEKVHSAHSPAAPTPATDGRRVYVYFGSCGLLAYDFDGKDLWKVRVPLPENMFGTATSPVVVGDKVILVRDSDAMDSSVLAFDCDTGKQAWKTPRPFLKGSWSTPALWGAADDQVLVVLGTGRVVAYGLADGGERWSVSGFPPMPISTPVVGDGLLFAAKGGQGDPGQTITNELPKWDELAKKFDANNDGKVTADEIPKDYGFELRKDIPRGTEGNFLSLRGIMGMIDRDKNGITRLEWTMGSAFAAANEDLMLAIKPGGEGDVTETHVAWRQRRGLPELPSPIHYQGRLYLVKNGGIVTCVDPATGKSIYRERLDATGPYYASPVAADGKIYAASEAGVVSVFEAGDTLKSVAENDLAERVVATPAVVGNTIYVRTDNHLYAFENRR